MSIGTALTKSITGLQGAQAGLSVLSTNIAQANMPGYVRRELRVSDGDSIGNTAPGLQSTSVVRALDAASQKLMRAATAKDGEAQTLYDALSQLDALMGGPNSKQGIDVAYRNFAAALVTAANDRGNKGAQMALSAAAQKLATALSGFSQSVQAMRTQAESGLAATVTEINGLTRQLAEVNSDLGASPQQNDLLDRRDRLLDRLSALGDFAIAEGENGRVTVTTKSGFTLVGIGGATQLSFDARGTLAPNELYSTNAAARGVGTISAGGLDLLAGQNFNSGRLGALLSLRDTLLPASQRMVDDLAAGLALTGRDPAAPADKSLFLDGTTAFTALSQDDPQRVGLSQRLIVNPIYTADPGRLEDVAASGTENVFALISTALAKTPFDVRAGLPGQASGSTTVQAFSTSLISTHATLIADASDEADAAATAKVNFDRLFVDRNGVDINAQLADMVALQNAYAANANVIKTIKQMFDILNNI